MAKIQLTTSELLSQSSEMSNLKTQYEELFGAVSNILKNTNVNWSANLENSFSSKILSAQNSFSKVVDMLQAGAEAAHTSAMTFESLDGQLGNVMSNLNGVNDAASANTSAPDTVSDNRKNAQETQSSEDMFWEELKRDWKNAGKSVEYLEEQYEKLPDWVRKEIESYAGEDMTAAAHITADILTGNVSLDTLSSYLSAIKMDGTKSSAVIKVVDMVLNKTGTTGKLIDMQEILEQKATQAMLNGDIGNGLKYFAESCGVGIGGIFYGSADVVTELGADFIDKSIGKISSTLDAVSKVIPGDSGEVVCDISSGIKTISGWISNSVRGLL